MGYNGAEVLWECLVREGVETVWGYPGGAALPLFVVAAVAAVALGVAVRFVGLFFVGVARGETHLSWLPPDLAGPTSVLVRAGMVLVSIVLAAPLITGNDDGTLSRAGVVALVALGMACTPVLACAAARAADRLTADGLSNLNRACGC